MNEEEDSDAREDAMPSLVPPEDVPALSRKQRKNAYKKKRRAEKLRLEKGQDKLVLEGEPPVEHYLTHTPTDMRCSTCLTDKQMRAPARKKGTDPEESVAEHVPDNLGLLHLDLLTCRRRGIHNCRYWLASKDQKSEEAKGAALEDKEPETTWDATAALYPGTRLQEGGSSGSASSPKEAFPRQFSVDGGAERKGCWKTNVTKRGGSLRIPLPGESRTNSRAEQWIRETERQVAC